VGELAKGGAAVGRPGTREDEYSPPQAKKLVLQVSKHAVAGSKVFDLIRHCMMCKYCNLCYVNDEISVFRLLKYQTMREMHKLLYIRLISWIYPRGRETGILFTVFSSG
jgi:hypothetical protein